MKELIEYYLAMRSSIFTGYLTMGSFLLTMMVFMITTMKEKYYDQPFYEKVLAQHRENDPKIGRLDKLNSFRRLLKISIYGCYITALAQLVIGSFVSKPEVINGAVQISAYSQWASIVCLASAVVTIIMVLVCIWALSGNMKEYIRRHNS